MNLTDKRIAELEYRLGVMKAFRDGKKIQWRRADGRTKWERTTAPTFDWSMFEYRIEKEKIERWVVWYFSPGAQSWVTWASTVSELDAKAIVQRDKCFHYQMVITKVEFEAPEEP